MESPHPPAAGQTDGPAGANPDDAPFPGDRNGPHVRSGAGSASWRDSVVGLVEGPFGLALLIAFALLEATVFPGPTEAMLIGLVLARPSRAAFFTVAAVAASVAGGIVGYHLGGALYEGFVRPLFASYGYLAHVDRVSALYRDNALVALATSGYTPVPYMLYTAMAGAAELRLDTFIGGSLIGRTLKYAPLAVVAYMLGPRVHMLMRRYGTAVVVVVVATLLLWAVLT